MTITRHAISATTSDLVPSSFAGYEQGYFRRATDPMWSDPVARTGSGAWRPQATGAPTAVPVLDQYGRTVVEFTAAAAAAGTVRMYGPDFTPAPADGQFVRVSAYASNPGTLLVHATVYLTLDSGTATLVAGSGDTPVPPGGTEVEVWKVFRITGNPTSASVDLAQRRLSTPTSVPTVTRWSDASVTPVTYETVLDLHPTEAMVRMDESWSPYIQATITCPMPQPDVLDRIDPRRPTRVRVRLSRTSADARLARHLTPDATEVRRNLIRNPSFEVSTTGVSAAPYITLSTAVATVGEWPTMKQGKRVLTVSMAGATTTNPYVFQDATDGTIAANAGTGWVAWAALVRRSGPGAGYIQLGIDPRNASNISVSGENKGPVEPLTNNVVRYVHSAPLAAGATRLRFVMRAFGTAAGGDIPPDTNYHTDAWIACIAPTQEAALASVATYFDGDTPSTPVTGDTPAVARTWTGQPHASPSVEWSVAGPHVPPLIGRSTVASWSQTFAGPPPWKVRDLTALLGDPYETPARTDLDASTTLDLQLRAREVDHVAGTMTLELTSDEMSLQDFARFEEVTDRFRPPSTTSLVTLVRWGLGLLGWHLEDGADDAPIVPDSVAWNLGESLWDFLDAHIRGSDRRLWCDEQRRWRLTEPFTGVAGDTVLIDRPLDMLDRVSRSDGYADSVVAIYTWTEPDGTQGRTYGYADWTTGLPVTVVHRRELRYTSVSGATQLAAGLRRRAATRGRAVTVTAIADPVARPGAPLRVEGRVPTVRDAMVSAVAWEYPANTMTIRTREAST